MNTCLRMNGFSEFDFIESQSLKDRLEMEFYSAKHIYKLGDRVLGLAAGFIGPIAHGATSSASSSLRTSVISAASRRVLVRAFSIA